MLTPWSESSERYGVSTATREFRRGQIAERTVWTMVAEALLPIAGFDPCVAFVQCVGVMDILIAKLAVQTLSQDVLPRRGGFDVENVDA